MAKGGSRYGAGRPGYRLKAEQLQRIDVRIWARGGLLSLERSFSWSWNRGGEPSGSISVQVKPQSAVNLVYTATIQQRTQHINERVNLTYWPCRFGGQRPWFVCPRCAREVALLYMRAGRFACRHCQRVAYSSQSEDAMDRTWREQRRIEEKLGSDWQRPKGMRQRTYELLMDKLADCEMRREQAFCVAAARLLGERFTDRFYG